MKKRYGIAAVYAVVILALSCTVALADDAFTAPQSQTSTTTDVPLTLRLVGAPLDTPAYLSQGAVYLPLRAVCQELGGTVVWQKQTNSIVVKNAGSADTVSINLKDDTVTKGDHNYYMWGSAYNSGYCYYNGQLYLDSGVFDETFNLGVQLNEANKTVDLTLYAPNDISITTMKLDSDNDDIKITVRYPQIGGLADYDVQNSINATLRQAAMGAVDMGMAFAYDLAAVKKQYPDFSNKCDTNFDYLIKYNHDGILSVVLLDYQYSGGAHGGTAQIGYTFDLKTGKILQLADLMQSGKDYTAYIDQEVRSQIDERAQAGMLDEIATFATIGDTPDYYLSNSGVVIFFQQYEYFPYAAGLQEFTVPFTDLNPYLTTGLHLASGDVVQLQPNVDTTVEVGDIARIVLKGNPTTGYDWQYTVGDTDVVGITGQSYVPDSDLIGAGGTYTWSFKVLKAGKTTIMFQYYRPWEGTANVGADNTKTFVITAK